LAGFWIGPYRLLNFKETVEVRIRLVSNDASKGWQMGLQNLSKPSIQAAIIASQNLTKPNIQSAIIEGSLLIKANVAGAVIRR
jgi:hypothetical protein